MSVKISALPAAESIADEDVVPIVDTSEGITKKTTVAQLAESFAASPGGTITNSSVGTLTDIASTDEDGNATVIEWLGDEDDTPTTIQSIVGGSEARPLTIINRSGGVGTLGDGTTLTLANNVGGTAANRILSPTGEDVVLPPGYAAQLVYSENESRWYVVSVAAATAGDLGLPDGAEGDVLGLDGEGGLENLGPLIAIPSGGEAGQYLGSDGAGGLAWFDLPEPDVPPIDLDSLAWTLAITGDDYDAGTGVATGLTTAGTSAGRDFSAPGTKPARGNAVEGHYGIVFDGTDKQLTCSATLGDVIDADEYLVFVVARFDGFGTAGNEGWHLPSVICDTNTYWTAGGADGDTPKKAVAYHLDASNAEQAVRAAIVAGQVHIIEMRLSSATLSIMVDGDSGGADAVAAPDVKAAGLSQTFRMGTDYSGTIQFTGTVYEVRVSDDAFDAGTRTGIREALADKYGITLA